jgi:hypothetical protein
VGKHAIIALGALTESGERCLVRVTDVATAMGRDRLPVDYLVIAAATAVEAHVSRTLARLIVASGVDDIPFGDALIRSVGDDFFRSWETRSRWLDDGFSLGIRGDSPYQHLQTVVQLRNAFVHGEGNLTDLQVASFTKLQNLKRDLWQVLRVQCHGRKVMPTVHTPMLVVEKVSNFVARFDDAVISRYREAVRP